MAASTALHQKLPVTPPAEHDSFPQWPFPPNTPHKLGHPVFGILNDAKAQVPQQRSASASQPQMRTTPPPHPQAQAPKQCAQPQPQGQTPFPFPAIPGLVGAVPHIYDRNGNPIDPRYVVMASRISAYYQQRCLATANYQRQRYQQWAAVQRQKCQDMVQAAMLVVAWYVRDRVRRKRRRQRRQFRQGLSRRAAAAPGQRPTKGERVRKWVLDVPEDVLSATGGEEAGPNRLADPEEARFQADGGAEEKLDKDAQLYKVADDMIKSQVHKLEMPLMGVLEFDESESDSEEDEEEVDQEQDEDDEMDDYYEEETEYYEDDDEAQDAKDEQHERIGSQEVQVSSGRSSQMRRSSCDS